MKNPQKENGYTAIANELLEQIVKLRITASEKDILFFVLRKTYGFHKKQDFISLSQFQNGTLLSRPTVVKALKNLYAKNILVKAGLLVKLNKDYEKWSSKSVFTSKGVFTRVVKAGLPKLVKAGLHTKEKRNITKESQFSSKEENTLLKEKIMKTIDYNTGEEVIKNSRYKKTTLEQRNLMIAVGSMWCEMVLKNTELEKEEIPCNKLVFFIKPLVLENWKYDDFKGLFSYWFKTEKGENKVNAGFCMNKTFIAKYKQYKRSQDKPVSNAQIAESIKL